MEKIDTTIGHLDGSGRRFVLVASRFNETVVDRLLSGAVDCLVRHGVRPDDLRVVRVPGAWEIPQALEELAANEGDGAPDAMIALGVVIRGETPHFDYICSQCSSGVAAVSARHRIPIAFGVLTCDDSAQAEARAGGKAGNKGREAAEAALEMADLFARLDGE